MLEDMLGEFEGTLHLVSHDRAFLDGVVTSLLTPLGEGRWLETAGGYADSLSQLPQSRSAAASAQPPSAKAARSSKPAAKLSYKDQRRLDEIDRLMPQRQAEITDLEARLADPELFARDPSAFEKTAKKLDEARADLEIMELEGLELLELQDKLSQNAM